MASGLAALLDDVAAIAKLAAASIDDVGAAAGKAGTKAVGVVVDDTAVTPGYAMGFTPDRELPIVGKIALGSLANKFIILLPGALLLSAFAPWLVTPLLMLGGAYLCFEAAEKILEAMGGEHPEEHPEELAQASSEMEREKVMGAIRTDFILSAEIMAIALSQIEDSSLPIQAASLAVVALAITVGVYGTVALIVKMDDIGLHLAGRRAASTQAPGRALVKGMPVVLSGLATVGTAAMLWVGGGIVVHGLEEYHVTPIPGWIHHAAEVVGHSAPAPVAGAAAWVVSAALSAVVGMAVGAVLAGALHLVKRGEH